MGRFTVIYDACVLYPQTLRDVLMRLALTDMFKARWSEDIHSEWMKAVRERKPDIPVEKLERTRQLMDLHVRDALVTGYQSVIPSLQLPDPDDRHVLAAAIVGRADAIVTFNLRDFPEERLAPYGIQAIHPDEFACAQFDLPGGPPVVCQCIKEQREILKNPPRTVEEHLARLEAVELTQLVMRLREYAHFL